MILLEGDKIGEVGPGERVRIPAGARIIDLSSATVLPGLIDMHTHITSEPTVSRYERFGLSVPRQALTGAANARRTLLAGFTTIRNVGAGDFTDVAVRDAMAASSAASGSGVCVKLSGSAK